MVKHTDTLKGSDLCRLAAAEYTANLRKKKALPSDHPLATMAPGYALTDADLRPTGEPFLRAELNYKSSDIENPLRMSFVIAEMQEGSGKYTAEGSLYRLHTLPLPVKLQDRLNEFIGLKDWYLDAELTGKKHPLTGTLSDRKSDAEYDIDSDYNSLDSLRERKISQGFTDLFTIHFARALSHMATDPEKPFVVDIFSEGKKKDAPKDAKYKRLVAHQPALEIRTRYPIDSLTDATVAEISHDVLALDKHVDAGITALVKKYREQNQRF